MNTKEPFAIISPERSDLDRESNEFRVYEFKQGLDEWNIPAKEVVGYFDDTWETSFVIRDTQAARLLGIVFNQDTVLEVDANGQAHLVSPKTGEGEFLGTFMEVDDPAMYSAYTYDPTTGKYWSTAGSVVYE